MAKEKKFITCDGNEAAAHVSYMFSEVAAIYPITPSSPMAEHVDEWSARGRKNLWGQTVSVQEMQSEGGAAGAVHGSLQSGALTTTFTASQGLLLMIPNMYKIAGELLPCVFNVSARTLASHALCIFGDHQDVMACRQTGFAMFCSGSVQEVMDLSAVPHLASLKTSVPFINFFDGFRTSHEYHKIECLDQEDIRPLVDEEDIKRFRDRAMTPERPVVRGTAENPETFFTHREASNSAYENVAEVVEHYLGEISKITGREYHLFDYYGAKDAENIIILMGSATEAAREAIDYLMSQGKKVGMIAVHLYRPFSVKHLLAAVPKSVKRIAVLDRTKEPGAEGEPLYLDVKSAFYDVENKPLIVGGRYGLGSSDTTPAKIIAVYDNLELPEPKNHFTVGIVDDVTFTSLPEVEEIPLGGESTYEAKFYGLGADGTVGANKNSIKIIGDHTDKYVQAYFQYDSKKTGGITISHLRFGDHKIRSPYYVTKADFVACHVPAYIIKGYKMVRDVKPGGTFLVNCQWDAEEFAHHLPAEAKRYIAKNNINVYLINAIDLAKEIGMGKRTNTILQSAFFALAKVLPEADALQYMKDAATHSYLKKGQNVVDMNHKAIDAGATAFTKIEIPADWATAEDAPSTITLEGREALLKQVRDIMTPVSRMEGDALPVSAFKNHVDGQFELGAAAYEKRGIAVVVPEWNVEKCIQCNQCAYVCPHAVIRPFVLTDEEVAAAPAQSQFKDAVGPKAKGYKFEIAVSQLDCTGCSNCVYICPADALTMKPIEEQASKQEIFDYAVNHVSEKTELVANNVKASQFKKPLLEFSGSCAGCAETSYGRLITQLFGDRMFISNATGCSSIWGNPASCSPFTTDANGHGPAWNNSLFEDNAEHGMGLMLGHQAQQKRLLELAQQLVDEDGASQDLKDAAKAWIESVNDAALSKEASKTFVVELEKSDLPAAKEILANKSFLTKKSFWIFGGDGWAYDIGFGGLDHVLASGEDINVFVFDTEVYSNTGGQSSKASRLGQVAQFAAAGKDIKQKNLAEIAMTYGYVYVAQVSMGANLQQTLKAIAEAEAYPGPSLIIGYSPCEMHSIKGGMAHAQEEMKKAVETGYWNLYRFNPAAPAGKKFTLDSKAPKGGYQEFLMNEARYSRLTREFPEHAEKLFKENEEAAMARYDHLVRLSELYAAEKKEQPEE